MIKLDKDNAFYEIYIKGEYLGTTKPELRYEYIKLCGIDLKDTTAVNIGDIEYRLVYK